MNRRNKGKARGKLRSYRVNSVLAQKRGVVRTTGVGNQMSGKED